MSIISPDLNPALLSNVAQGMATSASGLIPPLTFAGRKKPVAGDDTPVIEEMADITVKKGSNGTATVTNAKIAISHGNGVTENYPVEKYEVVESSEFKALNRKNTRNLIGVRNLETGQAEFYEPGKSENDGTYHVVESDGKAHKESKSAFTHKAFDKNA